jgi:hypothetical protein
MPGVMYYIADIMHNLMKVVPPIFLHTIKVNCDEEQLYQVGQWCYEKLSLIISDVIYFHTEKCVKKLNVTAEGLPGSTCRLLLDNYDTILKIAIKDHGNGEMNEDVYTEALAVWEAISLFNDDVTRGCDDIKPVAVEAHAQELDNPGAYSMAAYLKVAADSHVTAYMHIMACHIGNLVRQWGGLMKWCGQEAEAMHKGTKFFAQKR